MSAFDRRGPEWNLVQLNQAANFYFNRARIEWYIKEQDIACDSIFSVKING